MIQYVSGKGVVIGGGGGGGEDHLVTNSTICSFARLKDSGSAAEIDDKSADFEATKT